MPLIDLKEIMKFQLTTDLIPGLSFTGHADLKCTVKLENTKLESRLVKHLMQSFSNETTYRLDSLFHPKHKNDAKRAKVSLVFGMLIKTF